MQPNLMKIRKEPNLMKIGKEPSNLIMATTMVYTIGISIAFTGLLIYGTYYQSTQANKELDQNILDGAIAYSREIEEAKIRAAEQNVIDFDNEQIAEQESVRQIYETIDYVQGQAQSIPIHLNRILVDPDGIFIKIGNYFNGLIDHGNAILDSLNAILRNIEFINGLPLDLDFGLNKILEFIKRFIF